MTHYEALVIDAANRLGSKSKTPKGAAKWLLKTKRSAVKQMLDTIRHEALNEPKPVDPRVPNYYREFVGRVSKGDNKLLAELCERTNDPILAEYAGRFGITVATVSNKACRPSDGYTRTRATRLYCRSYEDSTWWQHHETEWRGGTPHTKTAAYVTVRYRSVVAIEPKGKRAVYQLGSAKPITVYAPCQHTLYAENGHIVASRRGVTTPLLIADVIAGLHSNRGNTPLAMPPGLAERFGFWEFGGKAIAEAEIARKQGIVRKEKHDAWLSKRDERACRLLARFTREPVHYDDARKIGYCQVGIQAWAASRGITEVEKATVPCYLLGRDTDYRARDLATRVARTVWESRFVAAL